MAQQPLYIPFLLGIGVRELSVAPHRIGPLHAFIRSLDLGIARREAKALLDEATVAGVERRLWLKETFRDPDPAVRTRKNEETQEFTKASER
jgi:phosphoenolpyruvate-protein kinase (PTS system EI component)